MRRKGELHRLAAPLLGLLDAASRRLHWWLGLLLLAYLGSGITVVAPHEVAVVLRLGALPSQSAAENVRGPGMLLALPRPFDEVIRVPVKKVFEVELRGLHYDQGAGGYRSPSKPSIDPEKEGYLLTGDHNVVHAVLVARYQVRDPLLFALRQAEHEALLRDAVMASMVRSAGEQDVDTLLTEGRKELVTTVTRRAQARLDALDSGLALVAIEFTQLSPPTQVREEFNKVQSAYIEAETAVKAAAQYREKQLPMARADRAERITQARADAAALLATARGDAEAFRALALEYRANPAVVRKRLYGEGMSEVLQDAGKIQFVPPPPPSGRYSDTRITLKGTRK